MSYYPTAQLYIGIVISPNTKSSHRIKAVPYTLISICISKFIPQYQWTKYTPNSTFPLKSRLNFIKGSYSEVPSSRSSSSFAAAKRSSSVSSSWPPPSSFSPSAWFPFISSCHSGS
uniref:Uncharacterized protein n=1 Tax=Torque teno calomys tener virus TaxID=2054616 RepID=A0A2H4QBC5_9VIRU|nr:hypothetical protein [Torque teno calomys tener virus]